MRIPNIQYSGEAVFQGMRDADEGLWRPDLFLSNYKQVQYEFGWTYARHRARVNRNVTVFEVLDECWSDNMPQA